MQIKLLAEGGEMKPGPALSQKLGPAGINIGQVISKVNEATKEFKGMKVPVELNVNTTTKQFDVKVFSPPVSELLKKELGIEKGSGKQKEVKVENASIEQIIKITKIKMQNLLCNDLKTAVKTVVGSCVSLGILIENKTPQEIEKEIDAGKYDKEIKAGVTETSEKKKKELSEFFSKIKAEQEKKAKAAEAAAAAAAAASTATTTETAGVTTIETPIKEAEKLAKKDEKKK
jgi:large subunit ribosomal protein L11